MNIEDIFLRARESGRRELTELESKKVFHSFGIPVVEGEIARTPEEAKQLTGKMGFPVVMKIASPDILHKTDVGGVKTGIKSLDGVEEAFKAIVESVHKKAPDARIEGITVQPMERRGLEVIVGGVRDPIFGNIVMFGLGGILTEVLKDVTFGLAPIIREEAREMIEGIRAKQLLHGYRGGKGVDTEAIADIMVKISELMEHPEIAEVDANPVFARADGAVCVDARIILSERGPGKEYKARKPQARTSGIEALFRPESVLLIGSSRIVEKGGMASPELFGNIRYNLKNYFKGKLQVFDLETSRLRELEGMKADTAVLALPPEEALEIVEYLNVRSIIHITGGFTESQRKNYRDIIRKKGIRVLGPNTIMGVISQEPGLNTAFERDLMPERGNIAVLSQSGGVGAVLLDWAKYYGIGISRFAFMGDKLDIGDSELLGFLNSDPETKVICIYMEGLNNGREFVDIVKGIHKPILVLKGGRSEASKKRAASHTASLAGSDEVFNAAFKVCGILRVESIEELFSGALALLDQPSMKGKKVAVVSNVGGPAILAADALEAEGLKLAGLAWETRESLSKKLPEIFPTPESVINPIDTIADARADRFELILEEVLQDPEVDGVMVINMLKSTFFQPGEAMVIAEVASRHSKPVVDVPAGGEDYFKVREVLKDSGLPTYNLPGKAAKVLRLLYDYHEALEKKGEVGGLIAGNDSGIDVLLSKSKDA